MIYPATPRLKAYLRKGNGPYRLPAFVLDDDELEAMTRQVTRHYGYLVAKFRDRERAERHMRDLAAYQLIATKRSIPAKAAEPVYDNRLVWAWRVVVLVILLVLLVLRAKAEPPDELNAVRRAFADPQQGGLIVQFQNAGSTIGTYVAFLRINCSTNLTCSSSGSTVTMTATGGAGGTPCTTTANAVQYNNAGAFGCLGVGTATTVLHGSAAGVAAFSAVSLANDVTGQLPIGAVGSSGLSGTSPVTISAAGAIGCSTCNTTSATVSSFSAGNLSPLFTTSVATATTTPALTFSLTNAGAGTVFGNNAASAGAPAYTVAPVLGVDNSTAGTLQLANGSSAAHTIWSSGATTTNTIAGFTVVPTTGHLVTCTSASTTCTLTDGGAAPTGTVTSVATTAPITGGTFTTSGTIACATCATTTNGGAISGTAPVAVSAAGAISITGAGGQVLAGASPAFTATPTLGTVSSATGSLSVANSGNAFLNIWGSNASTTATNTITGFAAVPATNVLPKCVVATTVCTLTATLATDDGTQIVYTGTGGIEAPIFEATGTTAGFVDYPQGTTSSAVDPCNVATSICEQAPTAVTSYLVTKPGVAANGIVTNNVASAVDTQGFSGDTSHSVTISFVASQTVTATSLCSTAVCPAGTYVVHMFADITTACTTSGTLIPWVGFTDDTTVAKGSTTTTQFDNATGAGFAAGTLTTTATTNYAQGTFVLRSTGTAAINYGYTTSACGSGTLAGKLYLSVHPVQ